MIFSLRHMTFTNIENILYSADHVYTLQRDTLASHATVIFMTHTQVKK